MNFFRAPSCFILLSLFCSSAMLAQQTPLPIKKADWYKAAIERRLRSKHPQVSADANAPVPGKYLLGRASARRAKLRARIQRLKSAAPHVAGAPATVYPGIQLRDFIPAGSIANSVVTGDFNRDGHMDFVVSNGGTDDLWIYMGKGDGTFRLPQIIPLTQGMTPVGLAAADLQKRGVLDLIVAEFDTSTIGVLSGNGDGTFGYEKEYLLPQPPSAVAIADFTRDGKLDISAVMVTFSSQTQGVAYLATLIGNGTGTFGAPLITMNPGFYSTANTLAAGDVNNDGIPDVLITGPGLENSQVYLGAGDGTFTPGATVIANGAFNLDLAGVLADVNEDGCEDAVVGDGNGVVWVATGDCAGNFSAPLPVEMGDSNASVVAVDMNGDGHLDLVTTTIPLIDPGLGLIAGNMVAIALGDGHGNFSSGRDYVGTGLSYSAAIGDFNGDGHPDVVSASPDTDTVSLFLNDGTANLGFPQGEWIGIPGTTIINEPISAPSFADLNGDGKSDVVILDIGYDGEYFITSLLNDGTGRFAAPVTSDSGVTLTQYMIGDYRLGDFRNTGHLDFVAIGQTLNSTTGAQFILFLPGNGNGTFGNPSLVTSTTANGLITTGDFNRDGKLDFVTVGASLSGWSVTSYPGNGNGTFRTGSSVTFTDSGSNMARVFAGDFNRDGKLDILAYDSGTSGNVWEFLGNGDGTFNAGQQLFTGFGFLALADVNGDTWADIIGYGPTFANFATYLDTASGTFSGGGGTASPYGGRALPMLPYTQFGDPAGSAFVADLNGDGKPDEIAWQYDPSGGDEFAQIMMGNGDGTFTPTYDIFDLRKTYGFPAFARVLDGTTSASLLEVDGGNTSMHVFKSAAAPSLQLELEEVEVVGGGGCGWVFLNVPSASSSLIVLSSSVPGVQLPGNVNIAAGGLSQRFCYTLSSSFDWHQVFDIRAQLGSDTAVAYAWEGYVVGFSEALSPTADQAVYPGGSSTPVTVSLTSSQGYTSTVQLSCVEFVTGESCSFGSNSLALSATQPVSTNVVVHTTSSSQGVAPVVVVASDGTVTKRQAFNLAVVRLYAVQLGNGNIESVSPGTASGQIVINGIPPYVPSCSGLPAGMTCSFTGDQLPYPSQTNLTLNVNVPAGVASGTYPFTVGIASGPTPASLSYTLYVNDFGLQGPSAGSAWALPGGTTSVGITAQSINLFSSSINVTCSLNVSGTCTGGTFGVSPNGTPLNLTVTQPEGAALGSQTLTVTGTYGAVAHSISIPFYVADYSGTLGSSLLTIARGGSGTVSATVSATSGFAGGVGLACSGASQLTCSFSPGTVYPTGSSAQNTTITVTSSATAELGHKRVLVAFAWMLPFGVVLGAAIKRRRAWLTGIAVVLMIISIACGGGGGNGSGGGGGHGSNSYDLTVTATAAGTGTSRTLGTIHVTVTH